MCLSALFFVIMCVMRGGAGLHTWVQCLFCWLWAAQDGFGGLNLNPLGKQCVPLTTEPSLQPLLVFFLTFSQREKGWYQETERAGQGFLGSLGRPKLWEGRYEGDRGRLWLLPAKQKADCRELRIGSWQSYERFQEPGQGDSKVAQLVKSLTIWVQFLGSTWWKVRPKSHKLFSDWHPHVMTLTYTHTYTLDNQ